eukprot:148464-Amorphochlora_amoeboformis.AAC.1
MSPPHNSSVDPPIYPILTRKIPNIGSYVGLNFSKILNHVASVTVVGLVDAGTLAIWRYGFNIVVHIQMLGRKLDWRRWELNVCLNMDGEVCIYM